MTDAPSPFAPFTPAAQPTAEPPKTETPKQQLAREKREAKAANKAQAAIAPPFATQTPAKPTRKKRTPTLKAHAPKFDLQTALAAFALLNEADHAMFEKLVIMLDDAGKPQRDRLLAAIGKVFG